MEYEKVICRFYSHVAGVEIGSIEEIPAPVVAFLSALDCRDMKKPFIILLLKEGKTEGQVCQALGVDRMVVRWIKRKFRL